MEFGIRSPTPERFVADSPLEEDGFEPSVPPQDDDVFNATPFASKAPPAPPERPARSPERPAVRIPLPPASSHQGISRHHKAVAEHHTAQQKPRESS